MKKTISSSYSPKYKETHIEVLFEKPGKRYVKTIYITPGSVWVQYIAITKMYGDFVGKTIYCKHRVGD